MDRCTLYGPAVTPAQVKAPTSRVALLSYRPPEAGKDPINSRILDAYKEKIVEFSPGDPSIIHAVAVASEVMPATVYRVLCLAGKMTPLISYAETVTNAAQVVEESSPCTVPAPDARPVAPERLADLVKAALHWCALRVENGILRLLLALLSLPAYLEDAVRQRSLHPYPPPVAPKEEEPPEVDESWIV